MRILTKYSLLLVCLGSVCSHVQAQKIERQPVSEITVATQNQFFARLSSLCGKAFKGTLAVDTSGSNRFTDEMLVMHVRKCSEDAIEIPFHVGNNASRTWLISKTGGGLLLKHDHRKPDGQHDQLTMYGGHTQTAGTEHTQAFPIDAYTQALFVALGYPQSLTNVWEFFVYDDSVTYRLTRAGFEFRVEFDTKQAVTPPQTPWGY
ncbi:MAG: hypothetical protein ABWW63_00020 [Glaciecola sp.]|jgi:hypothetical protein